MFEQHQHQHQQNGLLWKPGKSGNIEFCGNWKRLQENEPATAALIFGHESQEGFETQDSGYSYKIYHSQYGYSVGRRAKKKPEPITVTTTAAPQERSLNDIASSLESHFKRMEELTNSINNLIYCLCESNTNTTDSVKLREKIIKQ